jgi:hypothetical protein
MLCVLLNGWIGLVVAVGIQGCVWLRFRRMGVAEGLGRIEVRQFFRNRSIRKEDLLGFNFRYSRSQPTGSTLQFVTTERKPLQVYGVSFQGRSGDAVAAKEERHIREVLAKWEVREH